MLLLVHKSIWPAKVSCGNLTIESMTKMSGSVTTGFCPYSPYTMREFEAMLETDGQMTGKKQGKREVAARHATRLYEQKFLEAMFEPLSAIESPVKLQVGVGPNSRTELFWPQLVFCCSDNEGGNQIMCIKSTRCNRPCRCCRCCMADICVAGKPLNKSACINKIYVCML